MERALQDVRILDIYENASSARVDAGDWVDFLHLAKWNGRWVIVNVLLSRRPDRQAAERLALLRAFFLILPGRVLPYDPR